MITVTISIDETRHHVAIRSQGATDLEARIGRMVEQDCQAIVTRAIEQTPPTLAGRGINGR